MVFAFVEVLKQQPNVPKHDTGDTVHLITSSNRARRLCSNLYYSRPPQLTSVWTQTNFGEPTMVAISLHGFQSYKKAHGRSMFVIALLLLCSCLPACEEQGGINFSLRPTGAARRVNGKPIRGKEGESVQCLPHRE